MSKIWLLCDPNIDWAFTEKILIKSFEKTFIKDFEIIYITSIIIGLQNDKGFYITNSMGDIITPPKIIFFRSDNRRFQYDREILLLRHLEMMGAYIIDPINSIINCTNKFAQLQILLREGLPVAETICATNMELTKWTSHKYFDKKCVVKALRGCKGDGIFLSLSRNMLKDISSSLKNKFPYLFQEYIEYSHGRSLRVLIINNKVFAVEFYKTTGENLKSNELEEDLWIEGVDWIEYEVGVFLEAEELALKATSCLGLDIAGVDLLFKEDGSFVICEVNATPAWGSNNNERNILVVEAIINMIKERLKAQRAN